MSLSDVTRVAQRFQRSIRIDTDLDRRDVLSSFVCHESHLTVLENMARQILDSRQRAFTWTGPYGGGKSSLSMTLAALVSRKSEHRKIAFEQLGKPPSLRQAMPIGQDDWLVIPVVGRRSNPIEEIRKSVTASISAEPRRARTKRRKVDSTGTDVIRRLEDEANFRPSGGVLLIIDEMGKFLEGASSERIDIHFFQELAERANRCEGKLIVLGILHQTFEQYAVRLGRETQDEWAKVQGRFIDIPITTAVDEVINLIGRAIIIDSNQKIDGKISAIVAKAIAKRRPGIPANMSERLAECWPLHPVTAALLGPISRGKFAQNERSVFGFLCSQEPLGFQDYLRSSSATRTKLYEPDRLWDYLRANLEPAIMASPDGHRWAQSVEAVERCEVRGTPMHIRLVKVIAIIDLFRNGSGIMAERAILLSCRDGAKIGEVKSALNDLEKWSVIIYRKHLNAWAVYDGSDFDIHGAVETAKVKNPELDLKKLGQLACLSPLIAKEHYYRTGTLRWFESDLIPLSDCENTVLNIKPSGGGSGKFLLVIPSSQNPKSMCREICAKASMNAGTFPVAVGLLQNAWLLYDLGLEVSALLDVQRNSPELEGDAVARRELSARLAAISSRFEEELRIGFVEAEWYVRGRREEPTDERSLSKLLSKLASETYNLAPIIHNELINRNKPSSNSQAAVRRLLHCMVAAADRENLGIEGFKAERGLYSTILGASRLHGEESGIYKFLQPDRNHTLGKSFIPMWKKAIDTLKIQKEPLPLSELYELWRSPPFGIREGVLPILSMAFILAQRDSIAVYAEDMFQPELDDFLADQLLQNASQIKLRFVSFGKQRKEYLINIAEEIGKLTEKKLDHDALSVARELVRFCFELPNWTRRTKSISSRTQQLRRVLLNASDPHQTLFVDLPIVFDANDKTNIGHALAKALNELRQAYSEMLKDLQSRMLTALGHKVCDDFKSLHSRARTVSGLTGDFRLDAFATRLIEFNGAVEDMESIASLLVNKPPRDWSDREPYQAAMELADFALKFRHAEMLAGIKGRNPTRHALGIAFGTGEQGYTIMKSFDVGDDDEEEVQALAKKLLCQLNGNSASSDLVLAALAHVGIHILEQMGNSKNSENNWDIESK